MLKDKKVIFINPTGNTFVKGQVNGLATANLLAEFHVSIATFPGSILDYMGALAPFSEIRRRRFDSKLKPFTKTWPWYELGRQIALKAGFSALTRHEKGLFNIDSVSKNLDRRVANRLKHRYQHNEEWGAIFGCEDVTAFSFQIAKDLELKCLYDLPIGYWRTAHRLLKKEQEIWPEWAPTLSGFNDSKEKLARKDEELKLADKIFVASSFTASTLKDYPGSLAPIEIIPYGFPKVSENTREYSSSINKRPLKLLFVGSLSQRKGIANLFAAVESLKDLVELTIVGLRASDKCPALDKALTKHRWIPTLPHHEILKLMREQDVLVFPSLFEGFGLVITEAMAQGTPVITTDRTAGPDIIQNGHNGWLIEAGSTDALQEAIEKLLEQPSLVAKVGREAKETARYRPWEVYGQELAAAVKKSF